MFDLARNAPVFLVGQSASKSIFLLDKFSKFGGLKHFVKPLVNFELQVLTHFFECPLFIPFETSRKHSVDQNVFKDDQKVFSYF